MAVLVAGGTGFLGTAVVRELIGSGYDVAATWVVESERERLASEPVELIEADLFDPASRGGGRGGGGRPRGGGQPGRRLRRRAARARDRPGEFERLMRLNLMPAFLLARATMPRLIERGGGAFVCVSARTALRPYPGGGAYSARRRRCSRL